MTRKITTLDRPGRRVPSPAIQQTPAHALAHPPAPLDPARAIARARSAGISAVWTGDCSATVELARLAGPRDGLLALPTVARLRLTIPPPWRLAAPGVRAALYRHCLVSGTQFDIYRWINLVDLAQVWEELVLPPGVRHEWGRVLAAAGLVVAN